MADKTRQGLISTENINLFSKYEKVVIFMGSVRKSSDTALQLESKGKNPAYEVYSHCMFMYDYLD